MLGMAKEFFPVLSVIPAVEPANEHMEKIDETQEEIAR